MVSARGMLAPKCSACRDSHHKCGDTQGGWCYNCRRESKEWCDFGPLVDGRARTATLIRYQQEIADMVYATQTDCASRLHLSIDAVIGPWTYESLSPLREEDVIGLNAYISELRKRASMRPRADRVTSASTAILSLRALQFGANNDSSTGWTVSNDLLAAGRLASLNALPGTASTSVYGNAVEGDVAVRPWFNASADPLSYIRSVPFEMSGRTTGPPNGTPTRRPSMDGNRNTARSAITRPYALGNQNTSIIDVNFVPFVSRETYHTVSDAAMEYSVDPGAGSSPMYRGPHDAGGEL